VKRHTVGIDAMRDVACLTAGKFDREFYWYSFAESRRHETDPGDIAWNVLNWVGHTGIDTLHVRHSADGSVIDIELWERDTDIEFGTPEVIYVITKGN